MGQYNCRKYLKKSTKGKLRKWRRTEEGEAGRKNVWNAQHGNGLWFYVRHCRQMIRGKSRGFTALHAASCWEATHQNFKSKKIGSLKKSIFFLFGHLTLDSSEDGMLSEA